MTIIINKGEEETEARVLADFAREEAGIEPKMLILLIKDLISERQNTTAEYWSWQVIEYIEQKTGAVEVKNDYDVNTEISEWGLPVIVSAGSRPLNYKVKNQKYLIKLLEYLDEKENYTFVRISKYFAGKDKPKWVCQSCGRYLGKKLIGYKELQDLLTDFSIGKYWKCRSCKENNWFEIDAQGFIHFLSG